MVDSEKVIVVQDFNALCNNKEKFGGLRMNARVMEDFRDFVIDNNLFDVIPNSGNFTWTNRRVNFSRILERLDIIFTGSFWIRGKFDLESIILPITLSNHFPVQLNCTIPLSKVKGNFKFLSMWWRDTNFELNIEKWWEECTDIKGTPSYCFVKKMKYLKNKIKMWNVVSFKNIFFEKIREEAELDRINNLVIEKGMTNEEFHSENSLKAELAEILPREEMFWRDKSRELWIEARDPNSKFFHASFKAKMNKNRINQLMDDLGRMVSKAEELEDIALKYFEKILGSTVGARDETVGYLLDIIDKQILEEDNASLLSLITKDEVKKATFDLHPHKAPGPDRVTMELYQKCWIFMGEDIWLVVEEF
ncbi:hypothetical protein SUGI_0937580 [Cryptomeria japonica]|nr:hypothetical protein SUGI_0937580 [Cryptomeria japonica]